MKKLLSSPGPEMYAIEDFWEQELECGFENTEETATKEEFIEKYEDSSEFYSWRNFEWEHNWEWETDHFKEKLDELIEATRIKNGVLEAFNMGWLGIHGLSAEFEANAQNVLEMIAVDGDCSLEVGKEGNNLAITRYTHDEPTGAKFILKSSRQAKKIAEKIEKEMG